MGDEEPRTVRVGANYGGHEDFHPHPCLPDRLELGQRVVGLLSLSHRTKWSPNLSRCHSEVTPEHESARFRFGVPGLLSFKGHQNFAQTYPCGGACCPASLAVSRLAICL